MFSHYLSLFILPVYEVIGMTPIFLNLLQHMNNLEKFSIKDMSHGLVTETPTNINTTIQMLRFKTSRDQLVRDSMV